MHVDTKPNNMSEQKINQLTPCVFSMIELACSLHITFIGTNLPTSKKQYAVLQSSYMICINPHVRYVPSPYLCTVKGLNAQTLQQV
jgi:hypothetical protein